MEQEPCLCTSLRQTALAVTQIYDQALAPAGLKITMFRLLRRISQAGPPNISELAQIVELDRSTLGRNLKVLERLGLVRLDGGADERSKVVSLTRKGKAALDKAVPLWAKAQTAMKSLLGGEKDAVLRIQAKLSRDHAAA
jgi:DNA-binding MarR family transcriptional regulator